MPLAFAARIFLQSILNHGKKIQCAAKGKATSNIFTYLAQCYEGKEIKG